MDKGFLLTQLQQQIFLFMEDLRKIVPAEKRGLIQLVEIVFQFQTKARIMGHVIDNILPHKKQIESQDEIFFIENKQIFGRLPEGEVDYFGNLILKISPDEKNRIWEYFKVFIVLAEYYKKTE